MKFKIITSTNATVFEGLVNIFMNLMKKDGHSLSQPIQYDHSIDPGTASYFTAFITYEVPVETSGHKDIIRKNYGINEIIPREVINIMGDVIINEGIDKFSDDVAHGKYGNYANAYIYPHHDMRSTLYFHQIQQAFIKAYT